VPCPTTQQANLPAYLHTIPLNVERQSREAVNTNLQSLLVWLDEGFESRSTAYEVNAPTIQNHAPLL